MTIEKLIRDKRMNALIAWVLTAIMATSALESVFTGALLWGGFELFLVAIVAAPAVSVRDWTAIVSWPLVAVATFAAGAGAAGLPFETTVYLAVATLALIVVVELEAFTSVELSSRFAVGFAALTTMALQALWTVAQFYSDQWLGTEYLRSQTELQWDFVAVTAVALALGMVFQWYTNRFEPAGAVTRAANGAKSS
ncbi:hypothetical protein HALLA_20255 (plasmid) [Halostagnicola larsenii XH-48]|uniref:Uncharacterized protein n=1 Tax=Halostagnicola larsenii XH-48 TaxID=797299 RepID=W0JUH7_9EURY|nr:hypothetical protein [Halostagnicola larsenii]AHG02236.1 hypothetical protein HALLA_20255 [Halostagnicola larsenii XH-48]